MKAARPATAVRKRPRQQRSRATVDAITQAATYILVESGWEGLTTNAIAERAGVNISSLYQFFPGEEAIVAELQLRHAAESRLKLAEALEQLPGQPSLRDALALLVAAIVDEHRIAPAVHRAIAEELPGSVRHAAPDDVVEEQLLSAFSPFMRNVPNPQLACRIARIAVHAVIHETASRTPAMLDHPGFNEELVALLMPFLQRPAVG
ncbi:MULTISPECIES: TetR/AcrR family transcriptional regulator [unclassified Janthinobacterium]|uniref:TetR/AcrR family transcriptional regulator n=1 Tax=unclassified Janthinobacterium TaxID=2610881 RepID=UPI001610653B|nr:MULTISPECIES: TetR/AcrR family transcriptional regulator [unclassified Janthinobacterium]MBB5369084.1 AcrR family transcriptional regulator [Janthinobacterium sp. K2C7]MBB5381379.1 AcrR family transcriptional regulator [Janthinobacterium sp. K2Li3]MBB5387467.1 AcrR family transcriptional regulator [Janthinobacterium sp. K2E3]